ncbi:hypothetical protein FACS189411_05840 [Bacteroidia bacterium]|nr:hypothetical protein FACS189411_05840 [Bacteroidia bacterium]
MFVTKNHCEGNNTCFSDKYPGHGIYGSFLTHRKLKYKNRVYQIGYENQKVKNITLSKNALFFL